MIKRLKEKNSHMYTNYTVLKAIGWVSVIVSIILIAIFFFPSRDKENEPIKTPVGQTEKSESTGVKNKGTAQFSVGL